MFFAIITLLTALSLAAIAGWFSIIGIMAILAAAPLHAFVAGVTIELAKLVTTSWIYRNWRFASWTLRILLMFFTVLIMTVTSLGVFGFLSKAHIEQGASTVDNAARVERIEQQIRREESVILSAEKTLLQLDETLESYLKGNRADRSVVIRSRQAAQRRQLREEISAANLRIDELSEDRFKLQSEVRQIEIEVGPIRYISELIYGVEGNSAKNIESAVRVFIILLVLTLDPLAITLLVAANNTISRRQREKQEKILPPAPVEPKPDPPPSPPPPPPPPPSPVEPRPSPITPPATVAPLPAIVWPNIVPEVKIKEEVELPATNSENYDISQVSEVQEDAPLTVSPGIIATSGPLPVIRSPAVARVDTGKAPWMHQGHILDELIGVRPHFTPQRLHEEEKDTISSMDTSDRTGLLQPPEEQANKDKSVSPPVSINGTPSKKYPTALSWLNEFKGHNNGQY